MSGRTVRIDFTNTECTSIEELKKYEWVVSWSGGKDSTATIYLCHMLGVPIKKIVYVRMMWDENQPATLPIMTEFVDRQAKKFRKWGYQVELVPSSYTAMSLVMHIKKKSKRADRNGKPSGITQFARRACGMVKAKSRTIQSTMTGDYYELIGYTIDETHRIHRCSKKKSSILKILRMSQKDSLHICKENDGLSPLYDLGISRDGCWFCPNAAKRERIPKKELSRACRKNILDDRIV